MLYSNTTVNGGGDEFGKSGSGYVGFHFSEALNDTLEVKGCVYHLSQVRNTFQYPLKKRVKTKERRF